MTTQFDHIVAAAAKGPLAAVFGEEVQYYRVAGGTTSHGYPVTVSVIWGQEQVERSEYEDGERDTSRVDVHLLGDDVTPRMHTDYMVRDGQQWTVVNIERASGEIIDLTLERVDFASAGYGPGTYLQR